MTSRNTQGGSPTNDTAPHNVCSCESPTDISKEIAYIDLIILWASATIAIRNRTDRKRYIKLFQAYGMMDDVIAKRLLAVHGLCGVQL
jgi:hypothetical protein